MWNFDVIVFYRQILEEEVKSRVKVYLELQKILHEEICTKFEPRLSPLECSIYTTMKFSVIKGVVVPVARNLSRAWQKESFLDMLPVTKS